MGPLLSADLQRSLEAAPRLARRARLARPQGRTRHLGSGLGFALGFALGLGLRLGLRLGLAYPNPNPDRSASRGPSAAGPPRLTLTLTLTEVRREARVQQVRRAQPRAREREVGAQRSAHTGRLPGGRVRGSVGAGEGSA